MDLEGKPTTVMLLNDNLNTCPQTHREVWSSFLTKNTSLCKRWRLFQKTTTNLSADLQSQTPMATSTEHSHTEGSGTLQKKEQKNGKSQRLSEFAVRLYLLVMSEATPVLSHQ